MPFQEHHQQVLLNGESQLFASVRDLVKAQKEDPQLAAVCTSIGTGKIPSDCPPGLRQCYIQDDVLCRTFKESATGNSHIQFVIPQSLKESVLKEAHSLGHLGIKKTHWTL